MGRARKSQCALDVNILLDLACGKAITQEFYGVVRDLHYPLFISPTAFVELEYLRRDEDAERSEAATIALDRLQSWEIRLFDLEPLHRGFAAEFSRKLIRKGYLHDEEYNDGLILAEVAIKEIEVLVTMDHHLLDIEFTALQAELKDSGFFQTAVFAPWQVARFAK